MSGLSFITSLFTGDGPISTVLKRVIPDTEARARASEEMQRAMLEACQQQDIQQLEVNKVEAAHASTFVSGWRPFIGWVCGFGMGWQWVICPILTWVLAVVTQYTGHTLPVLPKLETAEMWTVISGMLGLGGLRTFEKLKGVSRSTMKGAK